MEGEENAMPENQPEMIHLGCPRCGATLQMEGEVLSCPYCGAKLILRRSAAAQAGAASSVMVDGISLHPFAYYDPQSNLEAFTILVPQGWQVSGGVTWVIERPAVPVQAGLQLSNPEGLEAFETYPNIYFTWSNNPLTQMTKPPGSLYFGYEVRKPIPAREAMREYVLPRYKKIQGLGIADEGPANELLQAVGGNQPSPAQGAQFSRDAGHVRLHYTYKNQPVAEEMSGVAEYTRTLAPGMFGATETIYWNMGYLTSFRAARERLETYANLYRAIFSSIKINPTWTGLVQQVSQGLTSNTIRHIQQIGALSHQISQNYNEMSAQNLQGWQERSAAYDRVAEKFSQTIREVDPYFDPNTGQTVELPSGYTQAWSTPLGEYLLTDDPNFNPNLGSNQTWTPLAPPKE
jgi:DNA-directed RNA polymerase subunit RPC12/RpoP